MRQESSQHDLRKGERGFQGNQHKDKLGQSAQDGLLSRMTKDRYARTSDRDGQPDLVTNGFGTQGRCITDESSWKIGLHGQKAEKDDRQGRIRITERPVAHDERYETGLLGLIKPHKHGLDHLRMGRLYHQNPMPPLYDGEIRIEPTDGFRATGWPFPFFSSFSC